MKPTNEPDDDLLREALRELGQDARRRAPSFQQAWRGAHGRRASTPAVRWWPAWALGAAAAICAALTLSRAPAPVPAVSGPLPTDFLLVTGDDDRTGQLADEITSLLEP